jgi:class 3 adenylate cyclase
MLRRGRLRGLTTLLFTDVVGSTDIVVELGDRRWRILQSKHHAEVRRRLRQHGGREVDTAGDGFFATFQTPAEGLRCAAEIVTAVRQLGLEVRAGIHVGETELSGEKIGGIAVTTAKRVESAAGPGQVFATETVVHTVAGSDVGFAEVGIRDLKGVPGQWQLFTLTSVEGRPLGPPLDEEDGRKRRDEAAPLPDARTNLRAAKIGIALATVIVLTGLAFVLAGRRASTAPSTDSLLPVGLVALDAGSGTIRLQQDDSGTALAFSSSASQSFVWVSRSNFNRTEFLKFDRTTGKLVDDPSVPLCAHPQIAVLGNRLWFTEEAGHVSVTGGPSCVGSHLQATGWNLATGPDRRIPLGDVNSVDALVAGAGYLWIGDGDDRAVYRVDVGAGKYETFSVHQGVDRMAFADGRLWILDIRTGALASMTSDGDLKGHVTVPGGSLTDMAVGGGSVWITDGLGNQIVRIPEDFSHAGDVLPLADVARGPTVVDHLFSGTVVVGFGDGTVAAMDPTSGRPIWSHMIGVTPNAIASEDGEVWVVGDPVTS